MPLSNEGKKRVQLFMLNMKAGDTYKFESFTKDEQEYILYLIKNQKGYLYETDGQNEFPETIKKFRRLHSLEDFTKLEIIR